MTAPRIDASLHWRDQEGCWSMSVLDSSVIPSTDVTIHWLWPIEPQNQLERQLREAFGRPEITVSFPEAVITGLPRELAVPLMTFLRQHYSLYKLRQVKWWYSVSVAEWLGINQH